MHVSQLKTMRPQGHGWEPGHVRQVLQGLIDKNAHVPKAAPFVYKGPLIGLTAAAVLKAWQDSAEAEVQFSAHFLHIACFRCLVCQLVCQLLQGKLPVMCGKPSRNPQLRVLLQACIAPEDWRPPPPAGFLDAAGMRHIEEEGWRPVRD